MTEGATGEGGREEESGEEVCDGAVVGFRRARSRDSTDFGELSRAELVEVKRRKALRARKVIGRHHRGHARMSITGLPSEMLTGRSPRARTCVAGSMPRR